jgi:hypothetical protein
MVVRLEEVTVVVCGCRCVVAEACVLLQQPCSFDYTGHDTRRHLVVFKRFRCSALIFSFLNWCGCGLFFRYAPKTKLLDAHQTKRYRLWLKHFLAAHLFKRHLWSQTPPVYPNFSQRCVVCQDREVEVAFIGCRCLLACCGVCCSVVFLSMQFTSTIKTIFVLTHFLVNNFLTTTSS